MIEDIQTNEQKLDAIYRIVQAQESRVTRAKWFRFFKWLILLVIVYYIIQNPALILSKVTELIMPSVMENMKTMMTDDLMNQIQKVLPK